MFRFTFRLSCRDWRRLAGAAALAFSTLGWLEAQENQQLASNPPSGFVPERVTSEGDDALPKSRLREGTVITNQAGHFRSEGEGAVFVTEKDFELVALPNLSLERISRTLKGFDEPESIRWSVSGVVTEFNGRNYLLINRAVYKASVPPPAPIQLAN